MNKDQIEGKVKDVAGRVERQAGEWTGSTEKQAHGAMKQVEGKVQNAWGDAKEAGKESVNKNRRTNQAGEDSNTEESNTEEKEKDLPRNRKAS